MEVYEYQVIAFVLNVKRKESKPSLKKKMQEFLSSIQEGHRFYLYGLELMDSKSSLLAGIANYKYDKTNVATLVKDACFVMSELCHAKKVLHIISDHKIEDYDATKINRMCSINSITLNYWNVSQIPQKLINYYKETP